MRRPIVPAAAALLTAGALGAPLAHAQTTPQQLAQEFNEIPDPGSDPSAPADDTADPADAPDAGEPADPADDNADPDEAATPAPTPIVTPVATPTAVAVVATATPTPPVAAATPSPTPAVATPAPAAPTVAATGTPTPVASPPPSPAATPTRRKAARRKVARAPRPATRRPLRPSGLSTRGTDRSAPARPVIRVRVAHRTVVAAPPRSGEYVVRRGDTLSAIAARYATTWPALWALNRDRIADPDVIYPGQVLRT
jgi:nucleoid-associated protein YgaU